jgi:tellurite resistance protein TerC
MYDDRPLLMWGVFFAVFIGALIFDLFILNRHDHVVKVRESIKHSAFYCVLALLFAGWLCYVESVESGGLFLTGYLVEMSLSMDNIFVISLVLAYFAVPKPYQRRVLFWGIIGVIVMRGLMIGLGIAVIAKFKFVLLAFALFLVYTGFKMLLMSDEDEHDISRNKVVKFFEKRLRVTRDFHGHDFFVRQKDPKTKKMALYFTPLMLALCVVEVVDIIFAVDSIPAILAITQDTYLVYTSNLFAIMGLRALYFTLSAMLDRFHYLKYALSLVLVFIGLKVIADKGMAQIAAMLRWMSDDFRGFAGFVESLSVHISPALSLTITLGTLLAGGLFSIYKTGRAGKSEDKATLGTFSAFPSFLPRRRKERKRKNRRDAS